MGLDTKDKKGKRGKRSKRQLGAGKRTVIPAPHVTYKAKTHTLVITNLSGLSAPTTIGLGIPSSFTSSAGGVTVRVREWPSNTDFILYEITGRRLWLCLIPVGAKYAQ